MMTPVLTKLTCAGVGEGQAGGWISGRDAA